MVWKQSTSMAWTLIPCCSPAQMPPSTLIGGAIHPMLRYLTMDSQSAGVAKLNHSILKPIPSMSPLMMASGSGSMVNSWLMNSLGLLPIVPPSILWRANATTFKWSITNGLEVLGLSWNGLVPHNPNRSSHKVDCSLSHPHHPHPHRVPLPLLHPPIPSMKMARPLRRSPLCAAMAAMERSPYLSA